MHNSEFRIQKSGQPYLHPALCILHFEWRVPSVPSALSCRRYIRVGLTSVANGMYWSQVSRLPRPARRPGKTHLRPLKRRTRLSSEIFATTYPRGTPAVRFSVVGDQGISNGRVNLDTRDQVRSGVRAPSDCTNLRQGI